MKILQLKDLDGYNLGLYTCPENVEIETVQKRFNELEARYDRDDDIHELIDKKLMTELNVQRVFSEEIFANRL